MPWEQDVTFWAVLQKYKFQIDRSFVDVFSRNPDFSDAGDLLNIHHSRGECSEEFYQEHMAAESMFPPNWQQHPGLSLRFLAKIA